MSLAGRGRQPDLRLGARHRLRTASRRPAVQVQVAGLLSTPSFPASALPWAPLSYPSCPHTHLLCLRDQLLHHIAGLVPPLSSSTTCTGVQL